MLIKLALTNFLSFSNRTEFDFSATKYSILSESNVYKNVLKGGMFIGPNASGKTNALKAIGLLIRLLKDSNENIKKHRCTFGRTSITALEYTFETDKNIIEYKIEYNLFGNTLSENLTINSISVLSRTGAHGELHLADLDVEENELDSNTLFLRTASFNTGRFPQEPVLRKLMDYLLNSYYITGYNEHAPLGKTVIKYAEENGVDKLNQYLNAFNFGFSVEFGNHSEGQGLKIEMGSDQKSLFFKRNSFPIPNIFYSESQGNQVFADMLPSLINIIENPGMLIIDEFGNSFHNKLSEKIISFFMENSNNSQFFITSHDSNLISNSVFRPDQIYLIKFEDSNGSTVTRVSTFKPREAQNLEKMYLGGMFEGVPQYD